MVVIVTMTLLLGHWLTGQRLCQWGCEPGYLSLSLEHEISHIVIQWLQKRFWLDLYKESGLQLTDQSTR